MICELLVPQEDHCWRELVPVMTIFLVSLGLEPELREVVGIVGAELGW